MKISIITATYNSNRFIEDCLKSVREQTYRDIEHIVIDGGSTDGTLDVLRKYETGITKIVSEKDNSVYEAMNKGLALATGQVIGFLHSDDLYTDSRSIEHIMTAFDDHGTDTVYGDLIYVDRCNVDKIIRHWTAGPLDGDKLRWGWTPPHPAFFVKKELYDKYGYFDTTYKIASDYDMTLRLLHKHQVTTHHLNEVIVKMRVGGISNCSIWHIIKKMKEDYAISRSYNFSCLTVLTKNLIKIPQLFRNNSIRRR